MICRIVLWACGRTYKIVMLALMPMNLKKLGLLILLYSLPLGHPAMADEEEAEEAAEKKECLAPQAPAILDGRSARKEQIQEMRKAVEAYITDNFGYRRCLEDEFKVLSDLDSTKAQSLKPAIEEAIEDSLEMDHLVADTFNTQLRIYKSLQE
jgi:hypothetical protein